MKPHVGRIFKLESQEFSKQECPISKLVYIPYTGGLAVGQSLFKEYDGEDSVRITLCTESRLMSEQKIYLSFQQPIMQFQQHQQKRYFF